MKEIKFAASQCVLPARIRFTFSTSGETKEEVIEKMKIVIDQLSKDEVHLDPCVHLESYLSGVNISCSPA
ncbi:hypothetical protein GT314_004593 [Salmonella enterica subsp. enterica]|nr:hypothetical protein [Salmonella enterica subsp. enterica serovar Kisangani]